MYNNPYMSPLIVLLVTYTLIIFSTCCTIYVTKSVTIGAIGFIKKLVKELDKIEEKEDTDKSL